MKSLIFLHIPKTAGSTLRTIIHRQHPSRVIYYVDHPGQIEHFVGLPDEERRKFRVIQGHVPYGFHQHLALPVDYITLLRHPVDLVVSLYYFLRRERFPRLNHFVEGKSLEEFADGTLRTVRNIHTRQISGTMEETPAALETAMLNLSERIAAFGLDTRFDESLILFKRRLGWRNVYYRRLNVNAARPRIQDVPKSTIALIERNNMLDLELYEFARRRFDETLARQEPSYWKELETFRRLNPVGGLLNEAYRRAKVSAGLRIRNLLNRLHRGR